MATTPASLSKEWRVGLIYGLLGAFAAGCLSYYAGHTRGLKKGLTAMHEVCYNIGGVVELDGKLIACTKVLDKPYTFFYNN